MAVKFFHLEFSKCQFFLNNFAIKLLSNNFFSKNSRWLIFFTNFLRCSNFFFYCIYNHFFFQFLQTFYSKKIKSMLSSMNIQVGRQRVFIVAKLKNQNGNEGNLRKQKKKWSAITTRTSVISTRKVNFYPHECNYNRLECHFHTHKCDLDTHGCDLDTQTCCYV
jgi:hypothetical protein